MRHKRARALFSAALDGELSPRQQQRFTQHVQHCDECRREFGFFQRMHQLLRTPEQGVL